MTQERQPVPAGAAGHPGSAADPLLERLTQQMLRQRGADGVWEGHLSSSALATAVAAFALHQVDPRGHRQRVGQALRWLAAHANADGGWGDTPHSLSHPSTTLLCRAALTAADPADAGCRAARVAADAWIARRAGSLAPEAIAALTLTCYGRDRTFSTPILVMCALTGLLGSAASPWRHVPPLPFELVAIPARWYRLAGLPVVSYALPALIALGVAHHRRRRSRLPGLARLRDALTPLALRKLARIQPASGGFLEAAPLTGFVALSLCAAGEADHPVVGRAVGFLTATVRADGSWPIDTNLKTWVTTQAVEALAGLPPADAARLSQSGVFAPVRDWLLRTQHRAPHPYTGAAPGGWAWTDLSGGVPDADDTAGALIALRHLAGPSDPVASRAAEHGLRWLLDLQNRDGGLPTFCRGWGKLPFDRSCPDLTAHAVAAMRAWFDASPPRLRARLRAGMRRALRYLERRQNRDGSWTPLWFGNEHAAHGENRTYGTAKAVLALSRLDAAEDRSRLAAMLAAAVRWLRDNQNDDGGWGGARGTPSSIEETALATRALAVVRAAPDTAAGRGMAWLQHNLPEADDLKPAPIGLYFASLWYWERLYPLIYALGACAAVTSVHHFSVSNNQGRHLAVHLHGSQNRWSRIRVGKPRPMAMP
ncbi:MAG: squalene--hopene cyclase [Lentisphaerae bacterium]|nr:squalene--hopene cyclase [Lentisphaerota bacterium]